MKRLLTAALATLAATAAFAEYPDHPITVVVPFAAGGPTDKVARDLGVVLGQHLKQTVIIENVGGAGGTLGAAKVAKASPDGYTLLLHHIGMATSPALYRKMPYETLSDFEYLGMINEVPMTLIGRPTLPANNYAELVKWLEANKGKINLANAGLGAASHLCGLLFMQSLKLDMTTVPYKGTGPAMTDLLGGQVDIMCDQTTNTSSQIEGGKVKAYAVTTMAPLKTPALAKLPTLDSQGLKGFNVSIWHALYAPKGTPAAVVEKVNKALQASLKDADFIKKQEALGAVVITDGRVGSAEHKKFVAAEIAKWGPAIKAAGQYAD
ncbi:MAG: tripartite tricarboxylate transporter substrate binding protein BugD [Proteobacteria bacterium]|uniref:tripartite tricarboxylate transporter substrate-binding protein n=1 Tax=Piscinibacter sp. TaxID=1903157 RepID=UPI001B5A3264|nr:tripartite tricarboxylate transporter substrate-binding protein [Piscinibacter sp.]MBP5989820.1 tripartite tricarboxylate transporter substrate binding protein BugD [Piscinibacter sp.]MBP6027025.1 tripartite tricarboxylate transporter substrate binding protein BugD [Piscinibacter sp.]MBS0440616.1 tripartite tricarboxylate transporter substrate binding protein BugD [Pseudomonadota bacterium]